MMVMHTFNQEAEARWICDFKARLVYLESPRPARPHQIVPPLSFLVGCHSHHGTFSFVSLMEGFELFYESESSWLQ